MVLRRKPYKKARRRLMERYHGPTVRRSFFERKTVQSRNELEWLPESHLIKNLCMLSPDSRNGRTYTPQAMEDLRKLYENAKGYQDHPDDPTAPRSTKERLGSWHNVRLENGKLRGDLHYDPNHPYANSLIWAVQNCPEHCGVSHNVEAEGYEDPENGHFTVTKVNEVRSVDVVDDPATNRSLLESHSRKRRPRRKHKLREGAMNPELDDGGMEDGLTPEHHLGAYISACCDDPNLDKAEKRKKIIKALDLYDEPEGEMEEEEEDEGDELPSGHKPEPDGHRRQEPERDDQYHGEIGIGEEEDMGGVDEDGFDDGMTHKDGGHAREDAMMARERRRAHESLQRLRKHKDKNVRNLAEIALRALPSPRRAVRRQAAESYSRHADPTVRAMARRLDAMEAKESAANSIRQAILECKAARLPKLVMSKMFIEDLAGCTDKRRRRAMIQERAHLASIRLPRSYGPNGIGGGPPHMSDADFAAMVDAAD